MKRSDFLRRPDAADGARYQIPDGQTINMDHVRRNSQFDTLIWKATQGTKSKDPTFELVRRLAAEVGFKRFMPYHWLSSTPDQSIRNAREQAAHHLEVVGGFRPNEIAVLDAEEAGITVETCCAAMDAIEQGIDGLPGLGKPMDVYTGLYVAGGTIFRDPRIRTSKFGRRTMHLAAYVSIDSLWNRIVALHLEDYDIDAWQWSSTYNMPGISVPHTDINQFISQVRYIKNFAGTQDVPPVIAPQPEPHVVVTPELPHTNPPSLGGTEVFKRFKLLKPGSDTDTFGAVFYGVVTENGIVPSLKWSGDGENPKVKKRYEAYEKLDIPWQFLNADQLSNIPLEGDVPVEDGVDWSIDQFGNP